jgi:LysM repeat protein
MVQTYTIQPGDTLSKISQKFFGDFSMVNAIAQRNAIANPNVIYPGTEIVLPEVQDAVVVSDEPEKKKSQAWILWAVLGIAAAAGGAYAWSEHKKKKGK